MYNCAVNTKTVLLLPVLDGTNKNSFFYQMVFKGIYQFYCYIKFSA